MAHLKDLTGLVTLDLDHTQLVTRLAQLTRSIPAIPLAPGDEAQRRGIGDVKSLSHLERLNLDDTAVTDAGLASLKGMSHLRWLRLDNTAVTDAGLAHLRAITQDGRELKGVRTLHSVSLEGTRITDSGLAQLESLVELTR